ncbi:glycosyltransferase family 9 protein [Ferrimonas marina]|uniref:ADP-heptose:LPS heptosyltransferase n=1 Tax=Ferrimonas marina TaxID=299255 RepID=A0A1M5VAF1_9GAMM|nr:glycosyltransferase family 9 protein [Ferrimonas marina]SHH72197.1 ADP-heptose:LPS heptosyltransferase [Ferrimonas marina]
MTPPLIPAQRMSQAKRMLVMAPFALGDFLYCKTFLAALKQNNPELILDIWFDDGRNNQDAWRLSRSRIIEQWIEAEPAFELAYGCCDFVESQRAQIQRAAEQPYDLLLSLPNSKPWRYAKIARQIAPEAFYVCGTADNKSVGLWTRWQLRSADALYTLTDKMLPAEHHITDRYYHLVSEVAGVELSRAQYLPSMQLPESYPIGAQQWLQEKFGEAPGTLFFLNHLSTAPRKNWQPEQMLELVQRLAEAEPSRRFVLNVTGEHFEPMQAAVAEFLKSHQARVAVFTVDQHFFELPAMISQADFVVTVDTAIMHFATAFGRPLVAMKRDKKSYWTPQASAASQVLVAKGNGAVSDISVADVLETVNTMVRTLALGQIAEHSEA